MSTHGPVQERYRQQMRTVAEIVDGAFNRPGQPKTVGFVLLTFEFGNTDDGRVNYISNGERADMITAMKELLARFEGRHPEETQSGAPGKQ